MFNGVRAVIAVVAGLLFLAGLAAVAVGGAAAGFGGAWLIVAGGVLIIALAFERTRYRSEASDRRAEPTGPGGGEPPAALEPRFQRTGEVFVDPTSGHLMRVFVDPQTGERRYRSEG
ncbi:MAG TPA: hypothetical protein VIV06_08965 [Candidatus Limnocylindrales bacterium]